MLDYINWFSNINPWFMGYVKFIHDALSVSMFLHSICYIFWLEICPFTFIHWPLIFLFVPAVLRLWASQVAQWVKNLPAMQEMPQIWVLFLGREDPLEEIWSDWAHTAQDEQDKTSVIVCTEPTLELCEMRAFQFHCT